MWVMLRSVWDLLSARGLVGPPEGMSRGQVGARDRSELVRDWGEDSEEVARELWEWTPSPRKVWVEQEPSPVGMSLTETPFRARLWRGSCDHDR